MKIHADPRYQSDSAAATAAESIAFPVRIFVRKGNYAAALAARGPLGRIEQETAELRLGSVRVEIDKIGFNHDADQKSGAGVDLSCSLVLGLDKAASLWARSDAVVRMLDLIQTFVDESRQLKEVQVLTGAAQNRPKGPGASPPPRDGGSAG